MSKRTVTETDSCRASELGTPRAAWPNPFYPWFVPGGKRKRNGRYADCIGPGNCWYLREGYTQCHDHADGACILAQGAL